MGKLRSALVVCAPGGRVAASGSPPADRTTTPSGGDDAAKTGGSIKIGSVLPDTYDPVMFQTVQANQPLQLVYTGLVTYKHAEGAAGTELIPGLAEAMPTVSRRQEDLHVQAALGPEVLRRHGRQGLGLRAHDQAPELPRRPVLVVHLDDRGRRRSTSRPRRRTPTSPASRPTTRPARSSSSCPSPTASSSTRSRLANAAPTPAAKSPFKASREHPRHRAVHDRRSSEPDAPVHPHEDARASTSPASRRATSTRSPSRSRRCRR